jgi:hypothetical protein
MSKVAKVIKGAAVEVSGKAILRPGGGCDKPGCVAAQSQGQTGGKAQGLQVPQEARIIESNSEYAIIEVTCSCGAKSHIQCNYAAMTKG